MSFADKYHMKINEIISEHIVKVKDGYRLLSHKGKNLGTFPTKSGAQKHEREVQYFKHLNEFDPGRADDDDGDDDNNLKLPYYDATAKTRWVDGISKGKKQKFVNFRTDTNGRTWFIIGDTLKDGSVKISTTTSEELAKYLVSEYLIMNSR